MNHIAPTFTVDRELTSDEASELNLLISKHADAIGLTEDLSYLSLEKIGLLAFLRQIEREATGEPS